MTKLLRMFKFIIWVFLTGLIYDVSIGCGNGMVLVQQQAKTCNKDNNVMVMTESFWKLYFEDGSWKYHWSH